MTYGPYAGKCGSCRWFQYPHCHRHAPSVGGCRHEDARWPSVGYFDWCGDHTPETPHDKQGEPSATQGAS